MKVICAPDKLKGSLSAADAASAMARGVRRSRPEAEIDLCPIADGGEGTVDALVRATGGEFVKTQVSGPLVLQHQQVVAQWGLLGRRTGEPRTAVIEMAAASGLVLVPVGDRNPMLTSTVGTGVLIKAALDRGAERIILGIGGSATNDGGCGAAMALGVQFFDLHGQLIHQPIRGGNLQAIHRMDVSQLDPRVAHTDFVVACDVTNPLTGPNGASVIYGPQKGATPEQVLQLDRGLQHLARLWREQLEVDVEQLPGSGAAGGLGGGLVAFLGGKLRRGADLVLDAVCFDKRIQGCDLCLTAEGTLDGQSLSGKACLSVAQAAAKRGIKTIALVGSLGPEAEMTLAAGLAGYRVIGEGLPLEESMRRAAELLEIAAAEVTRQA